MDSTSSAPVGLIVALVVISSVAILLAVGGQLAYMLIPTFRVLGMRVFVFPRFGAYRPRVSPQELEAHIHAYVRGMLPAFMKVVPTAHAAEMYDHVKTMRVAFRAGALRSPSRERLGLDDMNGDGRKDTITGLTYSPKSIEVGLLPGMVENDKVILTKTAWRYEFHNAFVQKYLGYDVSIAESFVSPDDARVKRLLEKGHTLEEVKKQRESIDAAFASVVW